LTATYIYGGEASTTSFPGFEYALYKEGVLYSDEDYNTRYTPPGIKNDHMAFGKEEAETALPTDSVPTDPELYNTLSKAILPTSFPESE